LIHNHPNRETEILATFINMSLSLDGFDAADRVTGRVCGLLKDPLHRRETSLMWRNSVKQK